MLFWRVQSELSLLLNSFSPLGRGSWFNPTLDGIINKVLCSANDVDRQERILSSVHTTLIQLIDN